jgi:hypothetical protein
MERIGRGSNSQIIYQVVEITAFELGMGGHALAQAKGAVTVSQTTSWKVRPSSRLISGEPGLTFLLKDSSLKNNPDSPEHTAPLKSSLNSALAQGHRQPPPSVFGNVGRIKLILA